jgi:hypothetical protein
MEAWQAEVASPRDVARLNTGGPTIKLKTVKVCTYIGYLSSNRL